MAFARDGKILLLGSPRPCLGRYRGGSCRLWSVTERQEIRRLSRIEEARGLSSCRLFRVETHILLDGKEMIDVGWSRASHRDVASKASRYRWAVRFSVRTGTHPLFRLMAESVATGTRGTARRRGGTPDSAIRLWELASGQEVARLELPEVRDEPGPCLLARWTVPGGVLCRNTPYSSRSSRAPLGMLAPGQEMRHFTGHLGLIWSAAFAPDGSSVISGSADGTALVWDISDLMSRPKGRTGSPPEAATHTGMSLPMPDARTAYRAIVVPSACLQPCPFCGIISPRPPHPPIKVTAVTEGPVGPPEVLRVLRAIAALERVGMPEARGVLEPLAHGDPVGTPDQGGEIHSRPAQQSDQLSSPNSTPSSISLFFFLLGLLGIQNQIDGCTVKRRFRQPLVTFSGLDHQGGGSVLTVCYSFRGLGEPDVRKRAATAKSSRPSAPERECPRS